MGKRRELLIKVRNLTADQAIEAMEEYAKQTAISFAEYTREAPGNTWLRATGEVLTTEQLFADFKNQEI